MPEKDYKTRSRPTPVEDEPKRESENLEDPVPQVAGTAEDADVAAGTSDEEQVEVVLNPDFTVPVREGDEKRDPVREENPEQATVSAGTFEPVELSSSPVKVSRAHADALASSPAAKVAS